ncbi:MAG: MFS transporter [Actinobacteria bacterium]|nr:MFS transporter [Actinomycetota bacterium]
MLAPVRLLQAVKPSVAPALLVAIASSTAIFAATPFLLPAIAKEYEVSVGAVGWMSTTQLGGFVAASWVGGRFLRPIRSVFITGAVLGVLANLASAIAPTFEFLTAARFVSGVSLGLAAWIAWQAAFGDDQKTGDVAVVGPLVGVVVAPGISFLIQTFGVDWTFVVLAAAAGTPLLFARQVPKKDHLHPHRTRHASTRAATAILIALGAITLGGSSVFVYGAAIGEELNGLTPFTISLLYSANALVAIPAARWTGRRGPAGIWFIGTSICAIAIAGSRTGFIFSAALISWGFFFFMGIPAAFSLLAARSNFPEERAGDAQAVMALGRVFGPLMGGALLAAGSTGALAFAASATMGSAAVLLLYIDRERFLVKRRPRILS